MLPMPPHLVAGVIKVAADPESTVNDLAKIIKTDAALSAQLLKAVNSAFYGLRSRILTVERSVAFLGIRAVRNLVLCFSVRELAKPECEYPLDIFWENSLRRASAAKVLSSRFNRGDPEEFFTTGLCQDIGVMLLIEQDKEDLTKAMIEVAKQPAEARRQVEMSSGTSHDIIGSELLECWQLPPEMVEPIRFHHTPEEADEHVKPDAEILLSAEAIADAFLVEDKASALKRVTDCVGAMGLSAEEVPGLMKGVADAVSDAASALEMKVGPQPTYAEIAEEASRGLLLIHQSYQNLTNSLEENLKKQREMASKLEQMNHELEHLVLTDPLTRLPNRRAYDESISRELERARRLEKPMALLLLDLDEFKKVNDTYGHEAGDEVLRGVASVLHRCARSCDVPARFGGEEFACILPHTDLEGAKIVAERLRQNVEALKIPYDSLILTVTVSIGVTVVEDPEEPRAGILALRRADDAMYLAKEAGRNRVMVG